MDTGARAVDMGVLQGRVVAGQDHAAVQPHEATSNRSTVRSRQLISDRNTLAIVACLA
jgi:hypothetical protein